MRVMSCWFFLSITTKSMFSIDQPPHIRQRDVATLRRVIQTTVRIFLDDPRFAHSRPLVRARTFKAGNVSLQLRGPLK